MKKNKPDSGDCQALFQRINPLNATHNIQPTHTDVKHSDLITFDRSLKGLSFLQESHLHEKDPLSKKGENND